MKKIGLVLVVLLGFVVLFSCNKKQDFVYKFSYRNEGSRPEVIMAQKQPANPGYEDIIPIEIQRTGSFFIIKDYRLTYEEEKALEQETLMEENARLSSCQSGTNFKDTIFWYKLEFVGGEVGPRY